MYTNSYSMLLNHIALQNYFKKFSKFKIFPIKVLFQAQRSIGRSTGSSSGLIGRPHRSTGPCVFGVHVLCTSAGRPDRSTD